MSGANYWQKRQLKAKQDALDNAAKYEAEYQKRLKKAFREIERKVKAWAKKYAKEDGTLTPDEAHKRLRGADSANWNNSVTEWERRARAGGYDKQLNLEFYRSRISRLDALQGQVTNIMANNTAHEVGKFQEQLSLQYQDSFHRTTYNIQARKMNFHGEFAQFSDDQLKRVVSKPWAGSDFSERLWANMTKKLPDTLSKTLSRGVLLGHSVPRMVKDARVTLQNASKYDVHRLVNTEFAHIVEQATLDSYKDSGVDRYEFMSGLEKRTCDACGGLDGDIFETKKQRTGVNYPPMHPNCRCTTGPWFDEMDDDYFNEHYGDDEPELNYDEWLDKYTKDPYKHGRTFKPLVAKDTAQLITPNQDDILKQITPELMKRILDGGNGFKSYSDYVMDRAKKAGYDAKPYAFKRSDLTSDSRMFERNWNGEDRAGSYDRIDEFMHRELVYSYPGRDSLQGRAVYFGDPGAVERYKKKGISVKTEAVIRSDAIIVDYWELLRAVDKEALKQGYNLNLHVGDALIDLVSIELGVDGWYNQIKKNLMMVNRQKVGIVNGYYE